MSDVAVDDLDRLPGILGSEPGQRLVPQKVFAKPFRLAFENRAGEKVWVEVKTLGGLKEIIRRLHEGEIFEKEGYTLGVQLWGVVADYIGFLRVKPSESSFFGGLQPFGEGAVALSEDLTQLFGSEDTGIKALAEMRDKVRLEMESRLADPNFVPEANPLLKDDGVNLTQEGEEKLADIIASSLTETTRQQENAEILYAQTEVEEESVDDAIAEEHAPAEGEVVTGEIAEDVGRRVEEAGMGELREPPPEREDAPDAE
jgi:hypothetical protein